MATATKIEIEQVVKAPGVRLDLTHAEGQVLADLVSSVVGDANGPRRHTEAIMVALKEAGYYWNTNESAYCGAVTGTIKFR